MGARIIKKIATNHERTILYATKTVYICYVLNIVQLINKTYYILQIVKVVRRALFSQKIHDNEPI